MIHLKTTLRILGSLTIKYGIDGFKFNIVECARFKGKG